MHNRILLGFSKSLSADIFLRYVYDSDLYADRRIVYFGIGMEEFAGEEIVTRIRSGLFDGVFDSRRQRGLDQHQPPARHRGR